jgi:hypothetical protein
MIFLNCKKEEIVQTNDKTRIDVSESFVSGADITDILIKPQGSENFISVFNGGDTDLWYLDWSYDVAEEKTISVQATDGVDTVDKDFTLKIVTPLEDNLYSNDSQIFSIETELRKYISEGRNSYINIHREAQSRILSYLDRKRIWDENGEPLTKDMLNLTDSLQKWSLYEAIYLIYTDLVVSIGDKFKDKANDYKSLRNYERDRGAIRIDFNKDGDFDKGSEVQDLKTVRMVIR